MNGQHNDSACKRTMKALILILIVALFIPVSLSSQQKRFVYSSRIGVVSVGMDNQLCFDIKNPYLLPGDHVKIIYTDRPQSIVEATVIERIDKTCSKQGINDKSENHYKLKHLKEKVEPVAVSIAVANPEAQFIVRNGVVSGDLDGDGKKEYFRICGSSEGLYLTVWSGKALTGKRKWHRYYYLGYDIEGDCTEKETKEP